LAQRQELTMQAILGLVALLGLAWLVSEQRSRVSWRLIAMGMLFKPSLPWPW